MKIPLTIDVSEIVHEISFHPHERLELFLGVEPTVRGKILLKLTKHVLTDLCAQLADDDLMVAIEELDPDEATDVIQSLPHRRQHRILQNLSDELKRSVEILTAFDPQTAAGIMNIDYIQVDSDEKIVDVAKRVQDHEKRTGHTPAIIALENEKVVGYVPAHQLGFAEPSDTVKQYIRHIPSIRHDVSHEEVVRTFKTHPHNKVAVLNERGNVIGIIYSDDVLRLMAEHQSASLYDFAGVNAEETVTDSASRKIRFRYKWLIINLGTAFLAAATVGLFEDTIAKYVLLAVYMPIVAGMGGNAGTQTLAVLVRGIALRQIELKTALPTLKREIMAGFANGLINGVIVAAVVMLMNRNLKIALVLGMAMIINLLVAASFGTIVPLIMKRFGKDPATSATIFITTATDVLGFVAFLGLATAILS